MNETTKREEAIARIVKKIARLKDTEWRKAEAIIILSAAAEAEGNQYIPPT